MDKGVIQGWGFGVFIIAGSSDVTVANVNVHNFPADGVYIGNGANKNILVYNVNSHNNGRQGMSITQVNGVSVINSSFTDTGYPSGFAPGCGIDDEPGPHTKNNTADVFYSNVLFTKNRGGNVCRPDGDPPWG